MRIWRRSLYWAVRICLLLGVAVLSVDRAGRKAAWEGAVAVPRHAQTGIVAGAEPVRIDRGRPRACLLLHGWLSTPADFGDLPRALDEAGWDVYAPLHPGHGTKPGDLEGITAQKLLEAAREHYLDLCGRCEQVVLVGFSMGGTVATILATERRPHKLVLIAPFHGVRYKWYYVLPPRWWAAVISPFVRYVRRSPSLLQVNRPEGRAEILAYPAFPVDAVRALFELRRFAAGGADLGSLRMPALMVYSTGDDVCSRRAMETFFEKLPGDRRRKVVFKRSNHHILHDYDRREAIAAITEFLVNRSVKTLIGTD